MMQVPGGMITAPLPEPEEAELRTACSAAESSVDPSHFIPVAKTGAMIGFAWLSGLVGGVRGKLSGAWAYTLLKSVKNNVAFKRARYHMATSAIPEEFALN